MISDMKRQVEAALNVLIGKILWGAGRAADIEWFQFGKKQTIVTEKGIHKDVGEYAVHVQCAWRISSSSGIFVASQDMYISATNSVQQPEDFDWDQPGNNRCDVRISMLLNGRESTPLLVNNVSADSSGGFCLSLSDYYSLEVFPDSSIDYECWRLFQPYKDGEHFIVTGDGIERS